MCVSWSCVCVMVVCLCVVVVCMCVVVVRICVVVVRMMSTVTLVRALPPPTHFHTRACPVVWQSRSLTNKMPFSDAGVDDDLEGKLQYSPKIDKSKIIYSLSLFTRNMNRKFSYQKINYFVSYLTCMSLNRFGLHEGLHDEKT